MISLISYLVCVGPRGSDPTHITRERRRNALETRGKRVRQAGWESTPIAAGDTRMTRWTRLTVPCCSTWAPTTPWNLHSHVTQHTGARGAPAGRQGWGAAHMRTNGSFAGFQLHSLPLFLVKRVISGISRLRCPIIGYGMQSLPVRALALSASVFATNVPSFPISRCMATGSTI